MHNSHPPAVLGDLAAAACRMTAVHTNTKDASHGWHAAAEASAYAVPPVQGLEVLDPAEIWHWGNLLHARILMQAATAASTAVGRLRGTPASEQLQVRPALAVVALSVAQGDWMAALNCLVWGLCFLQLLRSAQVSVRARAHPHKATSHAGSSGVC